MQDCSFFQLESENELTNYFNENNVSMFLISRQVDIYKLPKYSEKIITRTYVYECNEVYGYRRYGLYTMKIILSLSFVMRLEDLSI